jgi:hypothetical protein
MTTECNDTGKCHNQSYPHNKISPQDTERIVLDFIREQTLTPTYVAVEQPELEKHFLSSLLET